MHLGTLQNVQRVKQPKQSVQPLVIYSCLFLQGSGSGVQRGKSGAHQRCLPCLLSPCFNGVTPLPVQCYPSVNSIPGKEKIMAGSQDVALRASSVDLFNTHVCA